MASRRLSVPSDHPAFDGHFPERPILPGALLLDEALHLLEADIVLDLAAWELASAKFKAPVGPGTELLLEHEASNVRVRFTVYSSAGIVLEGVLARRERP